MFNKVSKWHSYVLAFSVPSKTRNKWITWFFFGSFLSLRPKGPVTMLILCQSKAVRLNATFPVSSSTSPVAVLPDLCHSWHILKITVFAWHSRGNGQSWSQLEMATLLLQAPPGHLKGRKDHFLIHLFPPKPYLCTSLMWVPAMKLCGPTGILPSISWLSILSAIKKPYSLLPQHPCLSISYTPTLFLSIQAQCIL